MDILTKKECESLIDSVRYIFNLDYDLEALMHEFKVQSNPLLMTGEYDDKVPTFLDEEKMKITPKFSKIFKKNYKIFFKTPKSDNESRKFWIKLAIIFSKLTDILTKEP
jgi:thymidylate synthase ThyX